MFCNKLLVITFHNMCAVSTLTSARGADGRGTRGSPTGLAAISRAPVPAWRALPIWKCHIRAGTIVHSRHLSAYMGWGCTPASVFLLLQAVGGCPSPKQWARCSWKPWEEPVPGRGWHGASVAGRMTVPRAAGEELIAAKVRSHSLRRKNKPKKDKKYWQWVMGRAESVLGWATPAPLPSPARCTPCSSSPSS